LLWLAFLCSSEVAAEPAKLSLRLAVYKPDQGPVRLLLRVENLSSSETTLRQNSGQAYDFAVYQGDSEVWRWSDGTFFIQSLQERVLAPGEILSFAEDWNRRDKKGHPLPPGHYTVKGWFPTAEGNLTAAPRPLQLGR